MGSQLRRLRRDGVGARDLDRDLDKAIGSAYSDPLPASLCHYTDEAGALGILKQRLVRATEATNQKDDEGELSHADDLIVSVTQRFADDLTLPDEERRWFADLARQWRNVGPVTVANRDVFIACFTERADNEQLWSTRYARQHEGYALEFKVLKETLKLPLLGMTWGRVEYDLEKAESRLVQALSGVMAEWRQSADRHWRQQRIARRALWLACCYSAIFTKSEEYADEAEWRMAIVTRPGSKIVKARRRYVEVQLRQDKSRPELRAIHVGRRAPEDAGMRMAAALNALGYPAIDLTRRP